MAETTTETLMSISSYLIFYRGAELREEFIIRCRRLLQWYCRPRASQKVRRAFVGMLAELELMTTVFEKEDWPLLHQLYDTYLAVQSVHSVLVPR